ncbi:hypothetical protein, partial [Streptomyces clavuligerus]
MMSVSVLESPLSPTTFKASIEFLGLSIEQVAFDLNVSANTVMQWRKKSRPTSCVTEYILKWLERTHQDFQEMVASAEKSH